MRHACVSQGILEDVVCDDLGNRTRQIFLDTTSIAMTTVKVVWQTRWHINHIHPTLLTQ
jgi:hypothetical protein